MMGELRRITAKNRWGAIVPGAVLEYLDDARDVGTLTVTVTEGSKGASMMVDGGEYVLLLNGRETPNGRFIFDQVAGNRIKNDSDTYQVQWNGQSAISILSEALVLPRNDEQAKQDKVTHAEFLAYLEAARKWARKAHREFEKRLRDIEKDGGKHVSEEKDKARKEFFKSNDTNKDGEVDWRDFEPQGKLQREIEGAPPPKVIKINNETPGELMRWAIHQAKERGWGNKLKVDFNDKHDSAGHRWNSKVSTKFDPGVFISDIMLWGVEHGKFECRMKGWTLQVFNMNIGKDHKNPRVLLVKGKNIIDAPYSGDSRNRVNSVYAWSDTGVHGYVRDSDAVRDDKGVVREGLFKVEGVSQWDELRDMAKAYIKTNSKPRYSYTYQIVPELGADPYKNYDVGDWIYVMVKGKATRMRVMQIVLQNSIDTMSMTASVVLNDVLLEKLIQTARRVDQMAGAATLSTQSKSSTSDIPRFPDGSAPEKPSAPILNQRGANLRVGYDGKDYIGDEPVYDQDHLELHMGFTAGFEVDDDTVIDTSFKYASAAIVNHVPLNTPTYFKFVALDMGGDRSDVSDETSVTITGVMPEDLDPTVPLPVPDGQVPATPTGVVLSPLGISALRVHWDKVVLNAIGGPQNDPVTYRVYVFEDNDGSAPGTLDATHLLGEYETNSVAFSRFGSGPTEVTSDHQYGVYVVAVDSDGVSATSTGSTAIPRRADVEDISAGYVYGGTIEGQQIIGGVVLSEVAVSGQFTAGAYVIDPDTGEVTVSGPTGSFGAAGIFTFDQLGNPRVEMPNDPSLPAVWRGDAEIDHLTVKTLTTLFESYLSEGSIMTLLSGVTPPGLSPSTTISYLDQNGSWDIGEEIGGYWQDGTSRFNLWLSTHGGVSARGYALSTGAETLFHTINWGSLAPGFIVPPSDGTGARVGAYYRADESRLYMLLKWNKNLQTSWYMVKFQLVGTVWTYIKHDTWNDSWSDHQPALFWDSAASQWLIGQGDAGGFHVRRYTWSDVTGLSTPISTVNWSTLAWNRDTASLYYGNADFGATRYCFVGKAPSANVQVWTNGTTHVLSNEWITNFSNNIAMMWWDGTNWWSFTEDGVLRKYEAGTFWTDTSTTSEVRYVAYDWDQASPHLQTTRSPVTAFTMYKRARVTIRTAPRPTAVGAAFPTGANIYLMRTNPGITLGNMWQQGSTLTLAAGAIGSLTILADSFAGAHDVTTNGFGTAGVPSQLKSAVGGFLVKGDGTGAWPYLVPVGTIVPFGGITAPPGWLLCNGQAVNRVTYADLYAVTANAFGAGDGSTTFNLPDIRGRIPLGAGTYAARGTDEGTATEASRTLRHQHGIVQNTHNHGAGTLAAGTTADRAAGGLGRANTTITGSTGNDSHDHGGNTQLTAVGDLPFVGLSYIIKI